MGFSFSLPPPRNSPKPRIPPPPPPPRRIELRELEQTAPGPMREKPRSRREGRGRNRSGTLPGRPLGPRTPGPPACPRRVSLIHPDHDTPTREKRVCFPNHFMGREGQGEPRNSDCSKILAPRASWWNSPRGQNCTRERAETGLEEQKPPAIIFPLVNADFLSCNQEFAPHPR